MCFTIICFQRINLYKAVADIVVDNLFLIKFHFNTMPNISVTTFSRDPPVI